MKFSFAHFEIISKKYEAEKFIGPYLPVATPLRPRLKKSFRW